MKRYQLRIHDDAQEDLERLHHFFVEIDPALAIRAIEEIEQAYAFLRHMPYSCRKANLPGIPASYREMVIDFGKSGYLLLFDISPDDWVTVMAVKHQREVRYH